MVLPGGLKGQHTCHCYNKKYGDQVDLPLLLSVSSAVVLVTIGAFKAHANQSRFQCQPQSCVHPHCAK